MFASYWAQKAFSTNFIASILLIAVSISSSFAQTDLTGTWSCDDGGSYYLRQIDDNIWWYGRSLPGSGTLDQRCLRHYLR